MKKTYPFIIFKFLIPLLLLLFFPSFIYAFSFPWQKNKQKIPIDPYINELYQKKELLEKYLEEKGYNLKTPLSEIKEEDKEEVIEKVKEIAEVNLLPFSQFSYDQEAGEYTFITGLNGTAEGKIENGLYEVKIEKISGVSIKAPQYIIVSDFKEKKLLIGLKKGRSKIKYLKKEKTVSDTPDKEYNQIFVIQLFHDENNNGVREKNEKAVKWAGVKVVLKSVGKENKYQFAQGINEISFEKPPAGVKAAFDFFALLEKTGAEPQWIKIKDGQANELFSWDPIYSFFGEDFPIKAKQSYQFFTNKPAVVKFVFEP